MDMPQDLDAFIDAHACKVQKIEQAYLKSNNPDIERRIRKVWIASTCPHTEELIKTAGLSA